ncbi:MAG: hypothetical protein HFH87_16695 [Lachnospiraceae bacterium]|nr:hypothetical protein [uncultured Acetatifactor sp.]MCI9144231.1 hypothetical protein [Lachnospiraceae bacterium]
MLSLFHTRIIAAFIEEGKAFATGDTYLTFIRIFFVLIGIKAITDGVLKGAGDVGVFTLANLVNLGIRVFVSFLWLLTGRWSRRRIIRHGQKEET